MLPKSLGWPLLKFLKNKSIDFFLVFRAQVKEHSLVNVFNPCFKDIDDRIFISFRAIDANDINEKILSYLYCYKKREGTFEIKNLSAIAMRHEISVLADPKLVTLHDRLWLTFNSGWSKTENKIFIWDLDALEKPPLECQYGGRNVIEKNWAFYSSGSSNSNVKVLYAADTMQVLDVEWLSDVNSVLITNRNPLYVPKKGLRGYTIGSQIIEHDGAQYFMVHKKIIVRKKRLYLGRLAKIVVTGDDRKIILSKHFFSHSFFSLFGAKKKHNKNLISCSYFSGLDIVNNEIIVSYGINDVDCNISNLGESIQWI